MRVTLHKKIIPQELPSTNVMSHVMNAGNEITFSHSVSLAIKR